MGHSVFFNRAATILAVLVLSPSLSHAQGALIWSSRLDGAAHGNDSVCAVTADQAGDCFVAGSSDNGFGGSDIVTIRYSPRGARTWTAHFRAQYPGLSVPRAIAVDGAANTYVAGSAPDARGARDYLLLKYDSRGALQWYRTWAGRSQRDDFATGMALDSLGHVYITGASWSHSLEGYQAATVCYNSSGAPLWSTVYKPRGWNESIPAAIASDGSGRIVVCGSLYGGQDSSAFLTLSYTTSGRLVWSQTFEGEVGGESEAVAIAADGGGNVYVAGPSQIGVDDFDSPVSDYQLVKYDVAGRLLWSASRSGGQPWGDTPTALTVDPGGNATVTGVSGLSSGALQFLTLRYDSAGRLVWANGSGNVFAAAATPVGLAHDAVGDTIISGTLMSGAGRSAQPAIWKFAPDGSVKWQAFYSLPAGLDLFSSSVATDPGGDALVAGSAASASDGLDFLALMLSR